MVKETWKNKGTNLIEILREKSKREWGRYNTWKRIAESFPEFRTVTNPQTQKINTKQDTYKTISE